MNPYDFTAEINAIVKRLGPMDLDIEPDDDCDVPLAPVTPPVWLRSTDALDNLTAAEKARLMDCIPSEWDVMVGWATPVLAAPMTERRVLIAAQMQVLSGLYDDPQEWCRRALELAGVNDGR
jgi:hypothetical protein